MKARCLKVLFNATVWALRTVLPGFDVSVGAACRDTKKTATMADVSLYLANVNVSLGRAMDSGQVRVPLAVC